MTEKIVLNTTREERKKQIRALEEEVGKLQNKIRQLTDKDVEEDQKEAKKHIGRCFKHGNKYYMIVSYPGIESTMTKRIFNPFQLPCVVLKTTPSINPLSQDTLFYKHLPEVDDFSGDWPKYEEVTQEEFFQKFDEVMETTEKMLKNLHNEKLQERFQRSMRLQHW